VPSFTFVATAHSLRWQEITPVFADIDPVTHNLDPLQVESLINERTSGIVGVHVWGRPCDTAALQDIATRHNLRLMYDAAHAFGCSSRGQMIGSFGEAEVFSFHATKFLNTFEGGAVVTNNDALAEKMRLMRNFGFAGIDRVIYVGTNGKMSEVCAAMGLVNLERMDEFIAVNRRHYEAYRAELSGVPGVELIRYDDSERNNYQYLVLEIDGNAAGLTRNQLVNLLRAENVFARRYFYPGCHLMEPYRSEQPGVGGRLPHTDRVSHRVLSLPTGTGTSDQDVRDICELIRFALQNAGTLRDRIPND
jgi:dTDP-4-amino-4,6-dideoxygalactose transaminase